MRSETKQEVFFFEKKKQNTFIDKVFLLLFVHKKKILSLSALK